MLLNNQFPKAGDNIIIEGVRKTVTEIVKNSDGDPVIRWISKHEEGACTFSIWQEWIRYAKLGDAVPKTRRAD